jgi:hypothetical protein
MTQEQMIDKAYQAIQSLRARGHSFLGYPTYNVTKDDLRKLAVIANKYGLPFGWLINLIRHETAATFNPAIVNSIGATGLFQFMTRIGGKKMTYAKANGTSAVDTTALRKMSFSEQLDYVDGYLSRGLKKHLNAEGKVPDTFTQGDLFMVIFYPVAVNKPNFVFPSAVQVANNVKTPMDYVRKALNKAIFPLEQIPYVLADVKKKLGETIGAGIAVVKRNFIPILIVSTIVSGLAFYLIIRKVA